MPGPLFSEDFEAEGRHGRKTIGMSFDRAAYEEVETEYDDPYPRRHPPGAWNHEQRSRELDGTQSRHSRKRKNRSQGGGRGQGRG